MNITQLFKNLRMHNVVLRLKDEKLLCELPKQGIPPELKEAMLANRHELKAYVARLTSGENSKADIPSRAPGLTKLPLSSAQQRLWLIDQVEEGESHYNTYFVFRVKGGLNLDALRRAFADIVCRHEALRTCFVQIDGEPVQSIMDINAVRAETIVHECFLPESIQQDKVQLQKFILQKIHHKFDLSRDLLIRITVISPAENEYLVIFVIHHIASDGWSGAVLANELNHCYQSQLDGLPAPLPPISLQYADFALWQQAQAANGFLDRSISYWCDKLAHLPLMHNLPLDKPRPQEQSFHGGRVQQLLPVALHRNLQELAAKYNVTMFMLLETALAVLVSYWSRERDIALGTPITGRIHPQLEPLIGFFVNTLVIRTKIEPEQAFSVLLRENKETIYEAFNHQELPFDKLVEIMQPPRIAGVSPLFQILFVMQNNKKANLKLAELQVEDIEFDGQIVKFDIELHATEKETGLELSWLYATSLFEQRSIEHLSEAFFCLLESIIANPESEIRSLPLLPDADKQQLKIWGHGPSSPAFVDTVHQLFERQASLNPQQIALKFDGQQLNYKDVNREANQLAHELLKRGIMPDDKVVLLTDRSFTMVISILAILKAGGCYVPLDPALPEGRLNTILSDLGEVTVLTNFALQHIPRGLGCNVLILDDVAFQQALQQNSDLNPDVKGLASSHLAYVLYTSGSTGKPKAIEMPHGPLINLIQGVVQAEPELQGPHTSIQFASIGFDMSFTDIFLTFSGGGCLLLIDAESQYDTAFLAKLIQAQNVSALNLPYAMLQSLSDYCLQHQLFLKSLQCIISTAEQLKITKAIRTFFENHPMCRLINHYGPSETHVITALSLERNPSLWPEFPSIGKPIANTSFYLLDDSMKPVPIGVVGQLYFGGNCLARGYMNQPELTAERFVYNSLDKNSSSRLYNTGDLARFLPDGSLEFFGRIDNQIKIRGFRVELIEIENLLLLHEKIKDAVVLVKTANDDEKYLVAYLTINPVSDFCTDDMQSEKNINSIDTDELRFYLGKSLPNYMIPSAFVFIDQFPLNINGKVNRNALPDPDFSNQQKVYVEPKTDVEKKLCEIWQEILRIDRVSTADNFFQIGGHSLSAVRMLSKINLIYDVNFSLKSLFSDATILGVANLIAAWDLNKSNFSRLQNDELAVEGFF